MQDEGSPAIRLNLFDKLLPFIQDIYLLIKPYFRPEFKIALCVLNLSGGFPSWGHSELVTFNQ